MENKIKGLSFDYFFGDYFLARTREAYYTIFSSKDREYLQFESKEMPTWDNEFVYVFVVFNNLVLIPLKYAEKIVTRKYNIYSGKCVEEELKYKFHINSN